MTEDAANFAVQCRCSDCSLALAVLVMPDFRSAQALVGGHLQFNYNNPTTLNNMEELYSPMFILETLPLIYFYIFSYPFLIRMLALECIAEIQKSSSIIFKGLCQPKPPRTAALLYYRLNQKSCIDLMRHNRNQGLKMARNAFVKSKANLLFY